MGSVRHSPGFFGRKSPQSRNLERNPAGRLLCRLQENERGKVGKPLDLLGNRPDRRDEVC